MQPLKTHRKITISVTFVGIVIGVGFLLGLIYPIVGTSTYAETTYSATSSTDLIASVDSTIIISAPSNVEMDITPDLGGGATGNGASTSGIGRLKLGSATIKVSTNDPWGYSLHMFVDTTIDPSTDPKSTALNHTVVSSKYLPSITTPVTISSEEDTKTLPTSWGFKTNNNPTAGNTPDRKKGQLLANTFYPLPTALQIDDEDHYSLIKQSNTLITDDETIVTFGAKSDPSLPAGTYESTVVFSAVANPELDTLTLEFNKNTEDTVTNFPDATLTITVIQNSDAKITLPNTTPQRTGYSFKGYSTEPSDTTGAYQPGDTYTYAKLSQDTTVTLYAIWEINTYSYTLNFNPNTNDANPGSIASNLPANYGPVTINYDSTAFYTIPSTTPTRTGYTFKCYSTDSTATAATCNNSANRGTTTYQPGDTYNTAPITADRTDTLYAIWEINKYKVTLSYDADGGTGAPASHSSSDCNYNTTCTMKVSATQPTRAGGTGYIYRFKGWATTRGGSVAYASGSDYSVANITANKTQTLYAVWEQVPILYNGLSMQATDIATRCANTATWDANNTSTRVTYTLKDTRDSKQYAVRKLNMGNGNAKCWMVQNLAYAQTNTTLSSTTSDVASGSTYKTPSSISTTAFTQGSNPQYSGDNNNEMHYDNNTAAYQAGVTSSKGAYYSWYVATAGTGKNTSGAGSRASASICPRGWRLPYSDGSSTTTNEFYGIYSSYGSNRTKFNAIYPLTLGGYYYNKGLGNGGSSDALGYWWSSVASSTSGAREMHANDSSVNPAFNFYKYYGFSVRCVAK